MNEMVEETTTKVIVTRNNNNNKMNNNSSPRGQPRQEEQGNKLSQYQSHSRADSKINVDPRLKEVQSKEKSKTDEQ